VNEIEPVKGTVRISPGVTIGYFAQHQIDQLSLNDTPLMHLKHEWPNETELTLRTFLGHFGFNGNDVFEPVNSFSGGEKSRLALAMIVKRAPSLLLLDEPTNHLDMEMRHALSMALQDYEGAMILVSHDRFLLRSTTDQFWLAADGKLASFDGDLQDYESWLLNYRKQLSQSLFVNENSFLSKKEIRKKEAQARDKRRPLMDKIKKLECEIQDTQKALNLINDRLLESTIFEPSQKDNLQTLIMDQAKYKKILTELEDEWLIACEQRDNE
jgi:ATP-binding cassette subfamily F protein 3